jgi:hypothetical protein
MIASSIFSSWGISHLVLKGYMGSIAICPTIGDKQARSTCIPAFSIIRSYHPEARIILCCLKLVGTLIANIKR